MVLRDLQVDTAVDPDAAGADVVDTAPGDPASGQLSARIAKPPTLQISRFSSTHLAGVRDAQCAVERARAEAGRFERRGSRLDRQPAERDRLGLLLRASGNADHALGRRGDDLDLGQVLVRQRPVDQAARGPVEIPLARPSHALARVQDHILPFVQGSGWPGRLRGQDQGVALRVVAGDPHQRFGPHVVQPHFGVPHVQRPRDILGVVGHGRQFFPSGFAFPMPRHGGQQRQVPGSPILERIGARETGAFGQPAVHDQGPEVPRPFLHARQIRAPEMIAIAPPPGHQLAAVERRLASRFGLDGQPVVAQRRVPASWSESSRPPSRRCDAAPDLLSAPRPARLPAWRKVSPGCRRWHRHRCRRRKTSRRWPCQPGSWYRPPAGARGGGRGNVSRTISRISCWVFLSSGIVPFKRDCT